MKASVNIGGLTGLAGILGSVNAQIQGAVSASSGLSAPSCLPEASGEVTSYKNAIRGISVSAQEIKTTIQDTISKWTSAESANMASVNSLAGYVGLSDPGLEEIISKLKKEYGDDWYKHLGKYLGPYISSLPVMGPYVVMKGTALLTESVSDGLTYGIAWSRQKENRGKAQIIANLMNWRRYGTKYADSV